MKSNFGQITKAVVMELDETSGRAKVRIPVFHGPPSVESLPEEAVKYWTPDDSLPWAEIMHSLGSKDVSLSSILEVGEVVFVLFTSASYRHPLIIGTTGKFV